MNDKSSKSPLNLELGARAEAKFEVKAEVPSASVGRFVDALTDLFRPFSEARGLKADLIRLQREEVAIRIARLAREQADAREVNLVSPPLKVLIPLFERASQEELDDKFILEAWAKLLVSACSPKSIPPRFISLIAEMNSRQAKLFLTVMEKDASNDGELLELQFMQQHYVESRIDRLLEEKYLTATEMVNLLLPDMKTSGVALDDIVISDVDGFHSVQISEQPYGTEEEVADLEMLKSLGLFASVSIWRSAVHPLIQTLNVRYFIATHMAEMFHKAIGA